MLALVGCGTSKEETPADDGTPSSPSAARACLTKAGFKVIGGPRDPSDTDAPDVELIVGGHGPGAFVAFYEALARAKRYEPGIRRNAKRFGGSVERRGRITIVWVQPPTPKHRARLEACLF